MKAFILLLFFSLANIGRVYVPQPSHDKRLPLLALEIAKKQIGVGEPWGDNRGPEVNKYLACVGLNPGNQWCMAMQQWCFRTAADSLGEELNLVKSGHCLTVWSWAKKHSVKCAFLFKGLIQPGDIMIMQHGETTGGHTGIIEWVDYDENDNPVLHTIEGNTTGPKDSKHPEWDGGGCFRKTRKLGNFGFLHIIGTISLFS
jgi:hypothetical protein